MKIAAMENLSRAGRRLAVALFGATLALASGCGGDAPAPQTPVPGATSPRAPQNEFTAAVPVGSVAATARLSFQLGGPPVVGQPLTVKYRVTPTATVQKIQVAFDVEPGLRIVDDLRATVLVDTARGNSAEPYELQLLPETAGVLLLKATVMTESDTGSLSTDFAIPLLVAATAPAPAAAPVAAPTDPAQAR